VRRRSAHRYYKPRLRAIGRWVRESRETTNFTYDITELNARHLAAFVAVIADIQIIEAEQYIAEIREDAALAEHVRRTTEAAPRHVRAVSDAFARFGRRLGWYALARATRPRVVVETGIDKGLGACVLCAALQRNAEEGNEGRYYGTDINPAAGWLLREPYSEFGEIIYGDSQESLRKLEGPVDLFVNDSDHSADYERGEYDVIAPKLSKRALVVGDNAHCTPELYDFAHRTARRFLYWQEWPKDHWYLGGGIGVAF